MIVFPIDLTVYYISGLIDENGGNQLGLAQQGQPAPKAK